MVCAVVFIHEKENWLCFSRLLSHHFPLCMLQHAVMYPETSLMYHNQDTFDFSQGHMTKNQPMAVRV